MTTLAFIGLGTMGAGIAGRLLAKGHTVFGYNRTASKARALIDRGLRWGDSPRAVAESADVIFAMVTDSAALEAIAGGPDGVLEGLTAGKTFVDMSTVSPAVSRALSLRVRQR